MHIKPIIAAAFLGSPALADTITLPFDAVLENPEITGQFILSDITPLDNGRCALTVTGSLQLPVQDLLWGIKFDTCVALQSTVASDPTKTTDLRLSLLREI